MLSILHDVNHGSPGMDCVNDLIKSDRILALNWAKHLASQPEEQLIRCENCSKTPEEVDGNPKFMVCSRCRSKLDFFVAYCSQ